MRRARAGLFTFTGASGTITLPSRGGRVTRRRHRSNVLLAGALALLACDEEWDLDVFVRVAPALDFDAQPALQIFVAVDDGGDAWVVFRVGFVCGSDPFDSTARLHAPLDASGAPVAVEGWVEPVPGGVAPFCGPLPTPERVSPAPAPPPRATSARTRADVATPVGCGGVATREATLELAAD